MSGIISSISSAYYPSYEADVRDQSSEDSFSEGLGRENNSDLVGEQTENNESFSEYIVPATQVDSDVSDIEPMTFCDYIVQVEAYSEQGMNEVANSIYEVAIDRLGGLDKLTIEQNRQYGHEFAEKGMHGYAHYFYERAIEIFNQSIKQRQVNLEPEQLSAFYQRLFAISNIGHVEVAREFDEGRNFLNTNSVLEPFWVRLGN